MNRLNFAAVLLFVFVLLLVTPCSVFAQQAPVTADAYTSGTNTGTNYGTSVVLFVTGPSSRERDSGAVDQPNSCSVR